MVSSQNIWEAANTFVNYKLLAMFWVIPLFPDAYILVNRCDFRILLRSVFKPHTRAHYMWFSLVWGPASLASRLCRRPLPPL